MEKIITLPDVCTVRMDGALHESDSFVAVLAKADGNAEIYFYADTLTVGMAMKMVTKAFTECMINCSEEEQKEIQSILGGAAIE